MASILEIQRRIKEYREASNILRSQMTIKKNQIRNAHDEGNFNKSDTLGVEYVNILNQVNRLDEEAERLLFSISPEMGGQATRDIILTREKNGIPPSPPPYERIRAHDAMILLASTINDWVRTFQYIHNRSRIIQAVSELNKYATHSISYRLLLQDILGSLPVRGDMEGDMYDILDHIEQYSIKYQLPSTSEEILRSRSTIHVMYEEAFHHFLLTWDQDNITDNIYRTLLNAFSERNFIISEDETSTYVRLTITRELDNLHYNLLLEKTSLLLSLLILSQSDLSDDPHNAMFSR